MASSWLLIFSLSLLCLHARTQSIHPQEREYECIDIYKQPSLQHTKLKNHQIQMRPSDEVLAMLSTDASPENLSNDVEIAEFDIPKEGCPQGQVPIHIPRTPNNHTKQRFHTNNAYGRMGKHAALIQKRENEPWRGASAWISVYQPKVTKDQFSMVLILLDKVYNGERNSIQLGWGVYPEIYGDHRTRLTTYWTGVEDESGCYNVVCKGFIQVNKRLFLGAPFSNISIVGGKQFNTFLAINQDPKTQNWLLTNGKTYIGYWPDDIVPMMSGGAKAVRYGGFTYANSENMQFYDVVSPPMGNGNKPLDDFQKVDLSQTCHMHFVKHVTQYYENVEIDYSKVEEDADSGKCYDVTYLEKFESHGQTFTFGGPGGYCE
ncbi:unnamed protein product [Cochlearia groenlandica]